jgi:hypothetical protein
MPTELETKRLVLREVRLQDGPALEALAPNPVSRCIRWNGRRRSKLGRLRADSPGPRIFYRVDLYRAQRIRDQAQFAGGHPPPMEAIGG